MINDTVNEFTSALSKRFGNPFVINFLFSWSFFNYKAILVMFSTTPISQKLTVLEKEIWSSWEVIAWCGFILPALFTLVFLYLMPYLVTHLELFNAKIERDRTIEKYKITKETPLSSEVAEQIQSENQELKLKNKQLDYTVRLKDNELVEERQQNKNMMAVESEKNTSLAAEKDALTNNLNDLTSKFNLLSEEHNKNKEKLKQLEVNAKNFKNSADVLELQNETLTAERDALKEELQEIQKSYLGLSFDRELYLKTVNVVSDLIVLLDKIPSNLKDNSKVYSDIQMTIDRYHAIVNNPSYRVGYSAKPQSERNKKYKELSSNDTDTDESKNNRNSLGY